MPRAVALAFVLLVLLPVFGCERVGVELFGPPEVQAAEAYEPKPDGPTFDHSAYDALLKEHVSDAGFVDYQGLVEGASRLDAYLKQLADADLGALGRDEKLAFLINAYNAFTLKLIAENYDGGKLATIKDIPEEQRWKAERWEVGGATYSLDAIEHEEIRPKFEEPRIHWALVCAAYSCPPLRNEAYTGDRVSEQLADQERRVFSNERFLKYDPVGNDLRLTKIMLWYGGDFEQAAGSVAAYVRENAEDEIKPDASVDFLDYSWKLNSQANRGG